mmetsp:Transcript_27247/g.65632  ORF Transcript_27247/g.65632 Transcript_27247/m.65632 type:complete len:204 (+) Transcript_27247:185-796(+)
MHSSNYKHVPAHRRDCIDTTALLRVLGQTRDPGARMHIKDMHVIHVQDPVAVQSGVGGIVSSSTKNAKHAFLELPHRTLRPGTRSNARRRQLRPLPRYSVQHPRVVEENTGSLPTPKHHHAATTDSSRVAPSWRRRRTSRCDLLYSLLQRVDPVHQIALLASLQAAEEYHPITNHRGGVSGTSKLGHSPMPLEKRHHLAARPF